MSILDTLRRLVTGSETAQAATQTYIRILAEEAIKSGDPAILVAVAAQWESMQEGRQLMGTATPAALPSMASGIQYTKPQEMRPLVILILQDAYLAGFPEVTTGGIQKQLEARMSAEGGWKCGDMEDVDRGSKVRLRWKQTLSACLMEMRHSGDIENDPAQYKTYRLAQHLCPQLPAQAELIALPLPDEEWAVVQ
jgi:hypothetical protein